MAQKHGSFIDRFLKSENAEDDAYEEEEPKYGVEELEAKADDSGDVEADADAEPIEIEVETADDVDDDVDAVAAAKLEEQMAALQQDLDAEEGAQDGPDQEMEEVKEEDSEQLKRLPEHQHQAGAQQRKRMMNGGKEALQKLVTNQVEYNRNKRPPLPAGKPEKPPLPPTPPPKWANSTPPETQESGSSSTKRQRVLDLRKGPFPKWSSLDEALPSGAVREIQVVPPRSDASTPLVVPPRNENGSSGVSPSPKAKASGPAVPQPPKTPPPAILQPLPKPPPAPVAAGKGVPKAFEPPQRWPGTAAVKGETIQERLQKQKAEELRKHAAKKTMEAQKQWWNGGPAAQVAKAAQASAAAHAAAAAAQQAASSSSSSRPVAGFSNAWEAVTLRLSAVDPSILEEDKKARKAFEEELELDDEGATLGLSFLNKEKLHMVLKEKENFKWKWHQRTHLVRQKIAEVDPSADALVREVMTQEEHTGKAVPKTPPKAVPQTVPPKLVTSPSKPKPPSEPPPMANVPPPPPGPKTVQPKTVPAPPPKPVTPKSLLGKPHVVAKPQAPQRPPPKPQPPAQPPKPPQAPPAKPQTPAAKPQVVPAKAQPVVAKPSPPAEPPKAPQAKPGPQPPVQPPQPAKTVAAKPRPHQPHQPAPKAPISTPAHPSHPPKTPPGHVRPPTPVPPSGPPPKVGDGPPKPVPKTPVPKSKDGKAGAAPGNPLPKREKSRSRSRERPESSAPNVPAGPGPVTKASESGDKESLDNWLRSLDGEGVMMMYSEALNREFSSISELSAAIVDPTAKGLKVVEPSLWEILGIQRLGHKLFFSQGLKNLQQ